MKSALFDDPVYFCPYHYEFLIVVLFVMMRWPVLFASVLWYTTA